MKRFLAIGFLTVLFSLTVQAAQNEQRVTLFAPVQVGATTLRPGDCKLTWTGAGSQVQLTFEVRGQKPVTVSAQMANAKNANCGLKTINVNGAEVLQSVMLDKITFVLDAGQHTGN